MKLSYGLILVFLTSLLAGCDQLGLDSPAAEQAREEAEGKAIGSACRQSGRALEECYQLNRRAPKAAIFSGWRDMDGYMRENKIEEVKPDAPVTPSPAKAVAPETAQTNAATADKSTAGKDEKPPVAKPPTPAPERKNRPALSR